MRCVPLRVIALAAGLSLAACGDSTPPTGPPAGPVVTALEIRGLPEEPLPAGFSVQLSAWAQLSDGSAGPADPVWNSSEPAVASVDQRGTVIARAEGRTRITATLGPVRAEAGVTVGPVTVALYNLTGRVVNHNGKPVASVLMVVVDGPADGQETRTGWDGTYFFPGLRTQVTVAARKDGYEEKRQMVSDPPAELNFALVGLGARQSFGGGQWLVGDEIVPRRYYTDPDSGCVWERRSSLADVGGIDGAAMSEPDPGFIAEGYFLL